MRIEIKNCNNIDNGIIDIKENTLNIKYAINGTGKSTIAKAIIASTNKEVAGRKKISLSDLTPFKYIGSTSDLPNVTGVNQNSSIMIFDEEYINNFIFQADDLLKGSFDIFIRGENYEKGMQEISTLVETMQKMFAEDKDIDDLINDFNEISGSFGRQTKSGIHASSSMAQAFKGGNKVKNIPNGLEVFKNYIQHTSNFKWIKWQLEGKEYIDISHDDCPYCTNNIQDKKETIKKVSEVYKSKEIESLSKIVATFDRLNKYFSEDAKSKIADFVSSIDGYTDDQVSYLREVQNQIDLLKDKFLNAKNLGFLSLKDVGKVIEGLNRHKIDIDLYVHLKSEDTNSKVKIVNNAIDELLKKANELHGSIAKQKILIERLIKENSNAINEFLDNAGYMYKVTLTEDKGGTYKLKLIHKDTKDTKDEVNNVKEHLSFGERNAFSLVLFMYDALKNTPDLIILDDPISSFDKNKKYAIIDILFQKGKSFRDKTVLLLTHDLEPIVDMVHHHTDRFSVPFAAFLENKHGTLSEKEILKSDIKTFIDINTENLNLNLHKINKLVYLRRLYEVINEKSLGYDVVSNIFHKRESFTRNVNGNTQNMTDVEIQEGCNEIKVKIIDFEYGELPQLLQLTNNDLEMKSLYSATQNNYEKLHIYRIIFDNNVQNNHSDIIRKFINEAFHIENDYIYQLNPCKYQLVPQYVIDECDKFINELN